MSVDRRSAIGSLFAAVSTLIHGRANSVKVTSMDNPQGEPSVYVWVEVPNDMEEPQVEKIRQTLLSELPETAKYLIHPESMKIRVQPGNGMEYYREKVGDYEIEIVAKPESMKERLSFLTGIPVTAITTTTEPPWRGSTPAPWKENKNWSPPIHSNNTRLFYKDGSYKDVPTTVAWEYFNDPDYSHSVAGPSSSPDNWWWDEKERRWVVPGINDKGAY